MTLDTETQVFILLLGGFLGACFTYPIYKLFSEYKIHERVFNALTFAVIVTLFFIGLLIVSPLLFPIYLLAGMFEAIKNNEVPL